MSGTESKEIIYRKFMNGQRPTMERLLRLAAGEPLMIDLPIRIPSGPVTVPAFTTESIDFPLEWYRERSRNYCDFARTVNNLIQQKVVNKAQHQTRIKGFEKRMLKFRTIIYIAFNDLWDIDWTSPQFAGKLERKVNCLYGNGRASLRKDWKVKKKLMRLVDPDLISPDMFAVNPASIELFPPELINQLLYNLRHVPLTPGEKHAAVAIARGPRVRHCDAAKEQDVSKAAISRMVARLRGKIPRETLLP